MFRCDAAGSSCLSSHCGFSLIVTLSVILLQVLTHLLTPSLLYFFQQSAILSAELLLSWCLTSAVAEIREIPRSQTPPSRSSSRNQRYTEEPNTPKSMVGQNIVHTKETHAEIFTNKGVLLESVSTFMLFTRQAMYIQFSNLFPEGNEKNILYLLIFLMWRAAIVCSKQVA